MGEMAAMADGRVVGLSEVVVALLLLAGVADADCFDYCYKNCIANDRSMADYCNYACDKTCEPGAPLRPLVAGGGDTLPALLRQDFLQPSPCRSCGSLLRQCYDGCKTKVLSRPLRAGAGVPTALGTVSDFPASEADADDAVRRASRPDHPSREKQEAAQPAPEPDKALRPASEPKDASVRPASEPKDASVRPASEPDKDDVVRAARGPVLPSSEPRKDDAVRWPFHHHDKDGVRPAWWPADGPRGANPGPEIHAPPPAPAV